jgi:hypothetical protein
LFCPILPVSYLGCCPEEQKEQTMRAKTYNSGYSLVVTHLTTNPPVRCLNRAERTGSLVFNVLWSYVEEIAIQNQYIDLSKANIYLIENGMEKEIIVSAIF